MIKERLRKHCSPTCSNIERKTEGIDNCLRLAIFTPPPVQELNIKKQKLILKMYFMYGKIMQNNAL